MSNGEKSSFGELDKFTKFDFSKKIPTGGRQAGRRQNFSKLSAFRRAH